MYFSNQGYVEDLKKIYEGIPKKELLREKKILITGASGLIGAVLTDFCLYLNDVYGYGMQIYALGRHEQKITDRFRSHIGRSGFHIILQDVTVPLALDHELDYIIHAAGDGYPAAFREHPVETMTPALIGTCRLLEAARQLHVGRFLYISSGEVYGKLVGERHAYTESESGFIDSMQVRSCYPVAKRAAETLCVSYSQEYGLDTVVARPGHIYGYPVSAHDNRATVQFLRSALKDDRIVLHSAGTQQRSYTYVADCVSALLTVLLHGSKGEAYNIANRGGEITIAEFARILAETAGVRIEICKADEVQRQELTPIEYAVLNPEKLENLGWRGQFDMRTGIERMYRLAKDECEKAL